MNGGQIAEVVVRHHLLWADGEGTCKCGWSDLTPLFGYHLLEQLLDQEDALIEQVSTLGPFDRPQAPETELSKPPATTFPSPRAEEMPERVSTHAQGPITSSLEPHDPLVARGGEPQRPDARDERMFEAVRAGVADSYAAIDRLVGLSPSTAFQRFDLLQRYGTLPVDMIEWRRTRQGKVGNRGRSKLRAVDSLGRPDILPGEWMPLCMGHDDYADWKKFNANVKPSERLSRPCQECPLSYALEMRSENRCNGEPGKAA